MNKILPREFELRTGSGTESLYIIIKALGLKKGEYIAHTDSMCFSDSQAIRCAGLRSHYLDIELKSLNTPTRAYEKLLDSKTIVLGVHGYGYSQDFSNCNTDYFIEDAALVFPEEKNKVGSYGIASFLSFGSGKPLDMGGGSVVGTDDKVLFKEFNQVLSSLNREYPDGLEDLSKKHTSMYNLNELNNFNSILSTRCGEFLGRSNIVNEFPNFQYSEIRDKKLLAQERLSKIIDKYEEFQSLTPYSDKDFPWRFSFLCKDKSLRTRILYKGIEMGLPISSWHPSLSSYIQGAKDGQLNDSNELGNRILNVDFSIDVTKFEKFLWRLKF